MNHKIITSRENPKIKEIIKLKSSRKEREAKALAVAEGYRELNLALQAEHNIDSLFFCPEFLKGRPIFNLPPDKLIEVSPSVFEKISFRENPDGVLAILRLTPPSLAGIKLSKNPLVIVLEAVEKPGNLGAILRTADAAGVDAVLISDPKTDLYNPNVIRASQGTIFTTRVAAGSRGEILAFLGSKGISLIATTPGAKKLYTQIDLKKPTAILMGTEDRGLSDAWLKAADEKVKIPMYGKIDSLNVSVSAAVIVYEALRQRTRD
ncbi:MAG: RNA methyltransferase [Patescibacteria group bacterium]